jgi:hypothetical protein
MNAAVINDFGPFLAIHDFVDQQKLPPSAKRLWGALSGLLKAKGSVYICREFFSKKLNLKKETISRALTKLEKAHCIKRTGEFKHNIFPIVTLAEHTLEHSSSVTKRSLPSDQTITDQRPFDHTNKKTKEIRKEQTVVDFSKREFSSNQKIALKQKLKTIGLHKHSIEKLIAKNSSEKIESQIEHLRYAIERGDVIQNQASWLMSAVEKGYAVPRELDKTVIAEEKQADLVREAAVLAQHAKVALDHGDDQGAKDIALKSLAISKNTNAEEILTKAQVRLERSQKAAQARMAVPQEKLQLFLEQARAQKMREFSTWYKTEAQILNNSLFIKGVEALVEESLLAFVGEKKILQA